MAASSELLNQSDIAIIQHEYGIYGGVDGEEVLDIIGGLRIPVIVIAHTIVKNTTPHQRSVFEAVAEPWLITWSSCPRSPVNACRLDFTIERRKVTMIPHGADGAQELPL